MIQITNLSLQYGNKHLFKDVSGRLNEQDCVGLVGVNGTGKSTLLKMLAGINETDLGVITRSKQATIGYLPQELSNFPPGRTLYKEAETAFAHLLTLNKTLASINQQLSESDPQSAYFSDLMTQQGELQHQLDDSDFFQMKGKIEKVLTGLGFSQTDMDKDCSDFSGGWQMRLMLSKLLLMHPSFLFLDEPTNHLDIESLTWLEDFLKSYNGALVIISHDRTFLDNLTTTTWELSLGRLNIYRGNYSKYLNEKDIRLEVQRAAYNNQQAKIQQTMRFVTRFRAKSTKAKQVQSRLKQLGKMDQLELEDSEMQVSFRFPPAAPSGRLAVETEHVCKSFDDLTIFNDLNLSFNRGDKVAIVGVNGAGKSTLVKMLAGLTTPDKGIVRLGYNVKISYFGQHQAKDLSPELTVLQTMEQIDVEHTTTKIRSLLGAFLFSGDDVDKKVMVLSGGEKSRLALAKMIATPANLLIMDEPTNHLDIFSQEVLQEALGQYDGSILVVSHNRSFLDGFVNKVLEIKAGRATIFEGNISAYLDKVQREKSALEKNQPSPKDSQKSSAIDDGRLSGKEARKAKALDRELRNKKLGPVKTKLKAVETDIENLESEKTALEELLADPDLYQDQNAFAEKNILYKKVDTRLARSYQQWETLQAELDALELQFSDS
jgi:ATP-binding cassette subfamily F protein 3